MHKNLHVVESSQCTYGYHTESAYHFFIECPNYSDTRLQLFNAISCYCSVSLDTILHGTKKLSLIQNQSIFDAVHEFIEKSNRFL